MLSDVGGREFDGSWESLPSFDDTEGLETKVTDRRLRISHTSVPPGNNAAGLLFRKILLAHPLQRGTDQVPIWFEQSGWNTRKRSFQSFCAILKHPRVLHGVGLGNEVRNALAINGGFSVEAKHGGTQRRIKWFVQIRSPSSASDTGRSLNITLSVC
jgi:hypothetical protein